MSDLTFLIFANFVGCDSWAEFDYSVRPGRADGAVPAVGGAVLLLLPLLLRQLWRQAQRGAGGEAVKGLLWLHHGHPLHYSCNSRVSYEACTRAYPEDCIVEDVATDCLLFLTTAWLRIPARVSVTKWGKPVFILELWDFVKHLQLSIGTTKLQFGRKGEEKIKFKIPTHAVPSFLLVKQEFWFSIIVTFSGGGGGGTQVQRGAAPALRISRKKGSFFKTSACPRFCKRRVLFYAKYTQLWRRVTPEVTGLPSLLPPLAAAKHAEDYNI